MGMYIKNSNLSSYKLNQLITEWIYGTPARTCARKIRLHRNTVNWWHQRIRECILRLPKPKPFSGEVEIDESYFGRKRPWLKGRGTADKVAVFGLRQRKSGQVWVTVVTGTDNTFLVPIIQEMVEPGSTIYSDTFGAYYHLKDLGYRHYQVVHGYTFVDEGQVHTNGIESFWSYAKHFIASKKGLPRPKYQIHLKEAEFRFNHRDPKILRSTIRKILKNDH